MMKSTKSLFTILVMAFVVLALTSVAFAQSGAAVEPVIVLSNTQAEYPVEFETTRLLVENMRQLGLQVEHKAVPWAQYSDTVWFQRLETPEAAGGTGWQMTAWRMVARPERMDPDEFCSTCSILRRRKMAITSSVTITRNTMLWPKPSAAKPIRKSAVRKFSMLRRSLRMTCLTCTWHTPACRSWFVPTCGTRPQL
jgi:hypothetical protein